MHRDQAIHQGRAFRIVGIEDDQSVRLEVIEQPGLRLAVVDRVLVVVEVVLRNIRDDGRVELRAGDAVLIEGVAGDFECRVCRVAGDHGAEPVGEQLGIGRRHRRRGPNRRRCDIRLCPAGPRGVPRSRRSSGSAR